MGIKLTEYNGLKLLRETFVGGSLIYLCESKNLDREDEVSHPAGLY